MYTYNTHVYIDEAFRDPQIEDGMAPLEDLAGKLAAQS